MIVPEEFEFRIITEHEDRLTICQSHCGHLLPASSADHNVFRQNSNNFMTQFNNDKFNVTQHHRPKLLVWSAAKGVL